MSAFTDKELDFLRSGEVRLARIATVGPQGTPHVVPTGWRYNPEHDTIDIGGANLAATKKYRDIKRNGQVAVVIDDVLPPWRPRCVEIRGIGEVIDEGPLIRIRPNRIVSWGLESDVIGVHHARNVRTGS